MTPRLVPAFVLASLLAASSARAEEPWQTDPESVAKELFFRGVKLLEAGDAERALDAFQRSRATIPRRGNTLNAAICLEKLGRFDEALELYEDVIARFATDLPIAERVALASTMADLRKKVSSVTISANVTGASVQIDGRPRGTLPLTAPIRVTAGSHVVRVVKNGYETFTAKVEVRALESLTVDAKLEPLTNAGELRIEVDDGEPAEVFVDGALVGTAPWEGLLSPGRHAVWVRRGELGSAPASLVVVEGQVSLSRLGVVPLGAETNVRVEPRTAELTIDGILVGAGTFSARLPKGQHKIVASEAGYISRSATVDSSDPNAPRSFDWTLAIDAAHPRWPRPPTGHFWVGATLSYAGAGSLGSGAEASCLEECLSSPVANGVFVAGRLGYRFPAGASVELGGAWIGAWKDVFRVERDSFVAGGQRYGVRYDVQDQLALTGPLILFGASYVAKLGWQLELVSRVSGGVFFARSVDTIAATARTDGRPVAAAVYGPTSDETTIVPAVTPELGLEVALGDARVGVSLAALFLPLAGPDYRDRSLGVKDPEPDPSRPGSVQNIPLSDVISTERSFGLVPIFLPGLSFRYEL